MEKLSFVIFFFFNVYFYNILLSPSTGYKCFFPILKNNLVSLYLCCRLWIQAPHLYFR